MWTLTEIRFSSHRKGTLGRASCEFAYLATVGGLNRYIEMFNPGKNHLYVAEGSFPGNKECSQPRTPTKKKYQSHGFKFQTCWTCYEGAPTTSNWLFSPTWNVLNPWGTKMINGISQQVAPFLLWTSILFCLRRAPVQVTQDPMVWPPTAFGFGNPNPSRSLPSASAWRNCNFWGDLKNFDWWNPPFWGSFYQVWSLNPDFKAARGCPELTPAQAAGETMFSRDLWGWP